MKTIILGALVAATVGLYGVSAASAAPISSAPISQATTVLDQNGNGVDLVQYRRGWRGGRGWRRGPVCRSVRVCGRYRCSWVRRCF